MKGSLRFLRERTRANVSRSKGGPVVPATQRLDVDEALAALLPDVRSWLHRWLGPRADLDDAVQETLVQIAKSLHRFEGTSSLRTWAYRITLRVAYRFLDRKTPVGVDSSELSALPDPEASPESRAMHRESVRRFRRCLDRLSSKRRMAFMLCAVEGLPHTEAAELEGVSVETLRARLKRARAELARQLVHDPVLAPLLKEQSS